MAGVKFYRHHDTRHKSKTRKLVAVTPVAGHGVDLRRSLGAAEFWRPAGNHRTDDHYFCHRGVADLAAAGLERSGANAVDNQPGRLDSLYFLQLRRQPVYAAASADL